jgi:hypothetical protein
MLKKVWTDENGISIPGNRITKTEKLKEAKLEVLAKKAAAINEKLSGFKLEFAAAADEIFNAVMEENGIKKPNSKGNVEFYNFNRTIKAEVDVSEKIVFDDTLIAVAKSHFDEFLSIGANAVDEMIRELILDAFSTSRGKLDAKKVTSLVKYRTRIDANKYPSFHKAIDAIERSISRPSSRRYFRISLRDNEGKYNAIDLNFSSI